VGPGPGNPGNLLRDLEEAIAENGDKPLILWEEAKKDLELE
jgi:hypothetical protein